MITVSSLTRSNILVSAPKTVWLNVYVVYHMQDYSPSSLMMRKVILRGCLCKEVINDQLLACA